LEDAELEAADSGEDGEDFHGDFRFMKINQNEHEPI
jgi:hypothetical protein